jgi:predicted metal-dependent phosphotriesterase family hydrolase
MPGAPPEGYGRVVMMASDDTVLQLQVNKSTEPPVYVVRNGAVVPEAKAIIALIKKHNLSMTTGHNSGQEAILLIKEGLAQGIPATRLSVTHANINPPGLTVEEMQEVARLGGFVEMCTQSQRAFTPDAQKALDARNDRIADLIKKVGPANVIIETDLGQSNNEYHPDGIAAFVRNMWARGISQQDTDRMTKENPAKFLGIPVLAAGSSQ